MSTEGLTFPELKNLYCERKWQKLAIGICFSLLVLLALGPPAFGQTNTRATLRGVVKDAKGGLVPGAAVTLMSVDRGDERKTETNRAGSFVFTSVTSGKYRLKVEDGG